MVRERGVEPLHPKALDPKSSASANSATPARDSYSVRLLSVLLTGGCYEGVEAQLRLLQQELQLWS